MDHSGFGSVTRTSIPGMDRFVGTPVGSGMNCESRLNGSFSLTQLSATDCHRATARKLLDSNVNLTINK